MTNRRHKPKPKSSRNQNTSDSGPNNGTSQGSKTRLSSTTFYGGCSELKGKIYDCSTHKEADKYITTTKAIAEYAGRSFTNGGDIRASILNESLFIIPMPKDPADNYTDITDANGVVTTNARAQVTYVENKMFELALGAHMKRTTMLEANIQKAYSLVLGQCTDLITTKIESSSRWDNIRSTQDVLLLLQEIKTICFKFEDHKYKPLALHMENVNFYNFRQKPIW